MLVVLFIIAIIAGLGVAYLNVSIGQQKQSQASIEDMEYNQAVASGFEIAKAFLLSKYTASTAGWDNELASSIANYSTYTPAASSIIPPAPYTPNYQTWFKWCRNINYHGGYPPPVGGGNTYFCRIENNNDGGGPANDVDSVLKLTIEAWGIDNNPQKRSQEIVLEAMVTYKTDPYKPTSAVVVGGSLKITGNASINGANGSIQSNGPVTLTANATVSGDVTSTGSISAPAGSIGGSSNPNSEEANIPPINPSDYLYLATHIFKTDGKVYDSGNNEIAVPTGWDYNAGQQKWSKTGVVENSGVFFFDGSDVDIGGSAGSAADPWAITILAIGYIDVSGSPSLKPDPNGGGIGLMAGTDLRMRGAGGNLYDVGLYAAHEQVSLFGTPVVNGVVLAEDAADICSLISTTSQVDVDISGSTEITYNGDLTTVLIDGHPYIRVLGLKKSIKAKY
jgi:hypothetical protein